ncbi:hypothetical protein T261_05774 [Streptomyces lydicus]|nr:hypothetical protein T261_05774 [Streptomyces lydicus]
MAGSRSTSSTPRRGRGDRLASPSRPQPCAGKADTAAGTAADTDAGADADTDAERAPWQFLGGPGIEPQWLQGEEEPGEGWRLVVQLTDGEPFFLNFGDAGIGYAFLSPDGKEGRFLWQCA